MRVTKGSVILEDSTGASPGMGYFSSYIDTTGTEVFIPNRLIVRLYELLKFDLERGGVNFDDWTNRLFPDHQEKEIKTEG